MTQPQDAAFSPALATGATPASSSLPASGLIDIRAPMTFGWPRFLLVLLLVMILTGLCMGGVAAVSRGLFRGGAGASGAIGGILGMLIFFSGGAFLMRRRLVGRIDRFARELDADPKFELEHGLGQCLEPLLQNMSLSSSNGAATHRTMRQLASVLAKSRLRGIAVRLMQASPEAPPVIEPLTVTFEPTPFDERAEGFWGLRGARPSRKERLHLTYQQLSGGMGRSRGARAFMFISLGMAALGFLVMIVESVFQVMHGRWPRSLVPLLVAGPIIVLALIWRLFRPAEWFLVPGALVVRESRGSDQRWRVQMIRRGDGALIYWREANVLAVADSDNRSFVRTVTPLVAEMAFRAWLSPVPPPPVERLSDLL